MHALNRPRHRHWIARAALCAALIVIACGEDGDNYAPLGSDRQMPSTVVAGDVRDPGEQAVADALVVIEPSTNGVPASAGWLSKSLGTADAVSTPGRSVTTTDEHGRFAFDDVASGDYFVQVIADDHLGAMQSINVPITLVDTVYVDVNLTPTATFSGVAELENASSHQGTVVYVQGTSYVAVTNPLGQYAITDVPLGSYTIRAEHAHYLEDTEPGTLTTVGENVVLPDMLLKLDSNIPPVATIVSATPQSEGVPTDFTASGSDADGSVVLYEWDWENDGIIDYSSAITPNTSFQYPALGAYTAKLRVTDNLGAIGLAAIQVNITSNRVYMATTGSDLNDGSINAPVFTLTKAYQIAQLDGKAEIVIAEGNYTGTAPAFLPGISILGGRTLPSWNEGPGVSQFSFVASRATANNITTPTLIRRLRLTLQLPAGGTNSIALYSLGSNNNLRFEECTFAVANGLAGTNGGAGNTGLNGNGGVNGQPGSCDGPRGGGGAGGTSPGGCFGGNGGPGGIEGNNAGVAGAQGACFGGVGGVGGNGVDGGLFCTGAGGPGGSGANGNPGAIGANGTAASNSGSIIANEWVPNTSGAGSTGASGFGGGGGGGGGGQGGQGCNDGGGNGGGGGGGGGAGGTGGGGGVGGRGSFCVMLVDASPHLENCTFLRGNGGLGGSGGLGGNGGGGGAGGAGASVCTGEVGRGGNGGSGGVGGTGGGGAGGPGGPSFGIYRAGTSAPTIVGATYLGGAAGTGGTGGGTAPNGPSGLFGTVF